MKQNYAEYHFSKTEILKYLIQSILLCGAMDYLFYQNWWLMLLTVPVTVLFMRLKKKGLIRERKRKLNYQFKDALNALSVAVQAGYSVENAVAACSRDLERLYPKETDIVKANAEGLKDWLDGQGYNATIAFNAEKAMYRVIVSSFADKAAAIDARNAFKAKYPSRTDFQGAWLLYRIY